MDKYHGKTACHPTRKVIPNSSRRILSPAFFIFSAHLSDFIPNQGGAFKFQMGSSLLHFRLQPGNALFQTIPGFILATRKDSSSSSAYNFNCPCSERLTVWGTMPCSRLYFFLNTPAVIRRTRSFLATRSLHMAIVSSICPFNGRMVIFGSSSPVGRIICSTIRGVERLVGSNFSTGSVDGLGVTRMSLGEVNKIPLNPSGAFSPIWRHGAREYTSYYPHGNLPVQMAPE